MAVDDLTVALTELTQQAHGLIYADDPPSMIGPESSSDFISSQFLANLDQKTMARFTDAARHDPVLGSVLGSGDYGEFVSTSDGSGSRISARLLGYGLIASAARRVIVLAEPLTLDVLLERSQEELIHFRQLLDGEPATGLAVSGYSGLSLAPGMSLQTPWGKLVPAMDRSRRVFSGGLETPVLLVREVPIRFVVGEPETPPKDFDDHRLAEERARAATLLALAATLALYRGADSPAATEIWQTTLVPGLTGRAFSGRPLSVGIPRGSGQQLSETDAANFERWAGLIEAHDHPSIQIAVRRILSAIQERSAPDDALIDAVIVVENLFGHGETTEVGFRVSSALALLLESDPAKRAEFRTDLGKVYGLRSKVVHGGEITDKDRLPDRRDQAIDTGVAALRELFENRHELISNRDRGIKLILGEIQQAR